MGCPQSHHIWHLVTHLLTSLFSVVIMGICGNEASPKPAKNTILYAKDLMAKTASLSWMLFGFAG